MGGQKGRNWDCPTCWVGHGGKGPSCGGDGVGKGGGGIRVHAVARAGCGKDPSSKSTVDRPQSGPSPESPPPSPAESPESPEIVLASDRTKRTFACITNPLIYTYTHLD